MFLLLVQLLLDSVATGDLVSGEQLQAAGEDAPLTMAAEHAVPRHGLEIDGCFLGADGPRQHHMEGSAASATFSRCGVGMRCRTTMQVVYI